MIVSPRQLLGWIFSAFRSHEDLILENLALRQQLLALHLKRRHRRLLASHKLSGSCCEAFGLDGKGL